MTCWLPAWILEGTWAFTWYKPGKPGARPLNITLAEAPPIVTVAAVVVVERGTPAESPYAG
jgi:hypothetical protein